MKRAWVMKGFYHRSVLGLLLLCSSVTLAQSAGNSLLISAEGRKCALHMVAEGQERQELDYCRKLAGDGSSEAQFELGEYYAQGPVQVRDLTQAVQWYEKASLQGHARAQYRLGDMLFRGAGVPVNYLQSYVLLKISGINGDDEAMDLADHVADEMPQRDLAFAASVLSQIFHDYMANLRTQDTSLPVVPAPRPTITEN